MDTERTHVGTKQEIDLSAPLLRIRTARPSEVVIAGPTHAYYVHWDPEMNRTQPCLRAGCVYCQSGNFRRPISYCAVLHWRTHDCCRGWFRAVLEVPFRTGLQLADLQGRRLSLQRMRPFGPVRIAHYRGREQLPIVEAFDIVPQLLRLWRVGRSVQPTLVGDDMI
jgi:hypothetical protein